ncbi:hypothetical protein [Psychrobacter sanguinis]|uniref:hypothetical protein n=1 Tax=Psychrobacter sanguinis TaxID=861445 RepID=UPI00191877BD|nr:hypothetical protein [Psychrobacter sanguinis]MCC3344548.1 hypothetical protein [Psychrobacter sanguinis]
MRYTLSINAVKCHEWGLNLNQGALFDLLNQASSWAKPHVINGEFYYWVSRNMVIDEIPLAYSKPDTVYRALKLFEEKGLVDYIKEGKKDLVKLTEKGKEWNSKTTFTPDSNSDLNPKNNQNSEINPKNTQNSDSNPSKFGNESEKTPKNSDLNPTNKNTNYKNTNNHINKKNTKKTKSKTQPAVETYKPQKPDEVSDQVWSDLLSHRKIKKTSNTQTAWNVIFSQLEKAKQATGHSLDQIITEWITRDWKGFKSDWYINIQNKTQSTGNNHANNQPANNQASGNSQAISHFDQLRAEIRAKYGSSQQSNDIRTVSTLT